MWIEVWDESVDAVGHQVPGRPEQAEETDAEGLVRSGSEEAARDVSSVDKQLTVNWGWGGGAVVCPMSGVRKELTFCGVDMICPHNENGDCPRVAELLFEA